ncbi:MAG TPA: S8/S53 family peptidase [Chitinophagaceae bacterium]|nr:S8/S53 family peptidase [Chitinophagaceae bacterium]
MVKIGIIDSGADIEKLGIETAVEGVRIYRDAAGKLQYEEGNFMDRIGHGTTCLSIIHGYAPKARYYIVKIFDGALKTDAQVLAAAVNRCVEQGVAVINISSGIQSDNIPGPLAAACDHAFNNNVIIVAAEHNFRKISFPACYPKVIGVGSMYLQNYDAVVHIPGNPIDFYTCDMLPGGQYYDSHGTSFACPKITGKIAQWIAGNEKPGWMAARAAMIQQSVTTTAPPHIHYPSEYGYEDVCDYDKETIRPLALKHLLRENKFGDIQELFVAPLGDPAFTLLRNIDIKNLRNGFKVCGSFKSFRQPLRELLSDENVRDADTIAIGRLTDYIFSGNERTVYREFSRLLQAGKDFMVFDKDAAAFLDALKSNVGSESKVYLPEPVAQAYSDISRFKYLPELTTPVLAIAGTGNRECVSTQVAIKKILEAEGYDVEYICPTPQGALVEACYSFPLVYWQQSKAGIPDPVAFIRNLLKGVQEFCRPDIIVTGLPDKVVPADNRSRWHWADTASFLYAAQPDALIMVIDEQSDPASIETNRQAAEAYAKAPVLFYYVYSQQAQYALRDFLRNKPVIYADKPGAAAAAATAILEFFSIHRQPSAAQVPSVQTS